MYAKESIVNADREPGKRLASSRDAGWHSLLVQKVESPFLSIAMRPFQPEIKRLLWC